MALAACGGGGGSAGSGPMPVAVTSRTPAVDAVCATVPTVIQVEFDAALVADQDLTGAIQVTPQGSAVPLAGALTLADPGADERLEFVPNPGGAGLQPGATYTVTLRTDLQFEGDRTLPATEWNFSIAAGAAVATSNYYEFPMPVNGVLVRPVAVGNGGVGMALDLGNDEVKGTFWSPTTRQWSTPVAMRPKQALNQGIVGDGVGGFLFLQSPLTMSQLVEIQRVAPTGLQLQQTVDNTYPLLLPNFDGGFTCWQYLASNGLPASYTLAPGGTTWSPVNAVASYSLGATYFNDVTKRKGVAPAAGGAVHSLRVARPAGSATAQIVIERRAANGALLQTITRDTGIDAADGSTNEVYDATGRVVCAVELTDSMLNRIWIGAIEHDPATGWGEFQALRQTNTNFLAGNVQLRRDGDRTAMFFVSAAGVHERLYKVDGGNWDYAATALVANGFDAVDFAIDAAGNTCMIEVTGAGTAFDVKIAKAPAGGAWSARVSGRERGVVPSGAFGSTAFSVHPAGNGKFLVVVGCLVLGGNKVASFEVE